MPQVFGWVSSAILVVTLVAQLQKQWSSGTSKGVSPWLFIGQGCASVGFLLYSWLTRDWVFVVTNVLTGLAAIAGLALLSIHARRQNRSGSIWRTSARAQNTDPA
jgi:MtN3 and saliva related transmembrane protein